MSDFGSHLLAQYADDSGAAAGVLLWLLIIGGLAFIPASIAGSKGYSRVAYWFFGLFFFLLETHYDAEGLLGRGLHVGIRR